MFVRAERGDSGSLTTVMKKCKIRLLLVYQDKTMKGRCVCAYKNRRRGGDVCF